MAQKESALFTVTPGSLSGLAVIFLLARGVFRSPERPESESASRERRDAARAGAGESERANAWNNWSATTGQNR